VIVENWLRTRMAACGDRIAIEHVEPVAYSALLRRADAWCAALEEVGCHDEPVAFQGDYSQASIALLLALAFTGRVAVPLSPSLPADRRASFLATANVRFTADLDTGRFEKLARAEVDAPHPLFEKLRASKHPGLVLFTSGSTGASKASLLDMGALLDNFVEPRKSLRTLVFLLIDHIGGINTLLATVASGGTLVTTPSREVDTVCKAIERHRVEVLPTSPTFLRLLLLSDAHHRFDLSSLKLITYGTEPMPAATLAAVHEAFPEIRLKQTYGLTELGIFRSQSRDSQSLWMKLGGLDWKVENGTLRVRTKAAMLGYLNAPDPFDAEGWYDTGDAVEIDGEYVRVLGRAKEIVNVGGEKVYPAEVESALLALPNVVEATVSGRRNAITGQVVVAVVQVAEPEDAAAFDARARAFLLTKLEPYKVPAHFKVTLEALHTDRFKKVRQEGAAR